MSGKNTRCMYYSYIHGPMGLFFSSTLSRAGVTYGHRRDVDKYPRTAGPAQRIVANSLGRLFINIIILLFYRWIKSGWYVFLLF